MSGVFVFAVIYLEVDFDFWLKVFLVFVLKDLKLKG